METNCKWCDLSLKKRKCLCNLHKAGRAHRQWGSGASRQAQRLGQS